MSVLGGQTGRHRVVGQTVARELGVLGSTRHSPEHCTVAGHASARVVPAKTPWQLAQSGSRPNVVDEILPLLPSVPTQQLIVHLVLREKLWA